MEAWVMRRSSASARHESSHAFSITYLRVWGSVCSVQDQESGVEG